MNSAKYRHRVDIQKKESVRNEDGQWVDDWVLDYKLWMRKLETGGDEYFEAKAVNAVRTVLWEVRFNNQLHKNGEGKRIYYDGQAYDIKNVSDKKGLRKELEITTEAVVS